MTNQESNDKINDKLRNSNEFEKLTNELDDFKKITHSLGRTILNLTNSSMNIINQKARDLSHMFLTGQERKQKKFENNLGIMFPLFTENLYNDFFYETDYEQNLLDPKSFFSNFFGTSVPFVNEKFENLKNMLPLVDNHWPTVSAYNRCVKKGGESVWDSNGFWRCLFPNSEFPESFLDYKKQHLLKEIITKDDFENALVENGIKDSVELSNKIDFGKKGIFFREFSHYLNWKNAIHENEKKNCESNLIERKIDVMDEGVVSKTTTMSYSLDSNTNQENVTETSEVHYENGSVKKNHTKKTKPLDSDHWEILSDHE